MNKEKRLVIMHFIGLSILHIGSVYALFKLNFSLEIFLVFFITFQLKTIGITVGYHRLFSHKSFKTTPFLETLFACLGTLAGQGPLMRWVCHHWEHHRHSDKDLDPHSPKVKSFLYAHLGWLFNAQNFDDSKFEKYEKNFSPTQRFISKNFTLIFLSQIPILYFLGGADYIWAGFFLSTTLCLHSTFFVNSLCHIWGSRPNETSDDSRNNLFVALLTNGEGWHNNHHHRPHKAKHGQGKYQLDISYCVIRTLEFFKVASNVRR